MSTVQKSPIFTRLLMLFVLLVLITTVIDIVNDFAHNVGGMHIFLEISIGFLAMGLFWIYYALNKNQQNTNEFLVKELRVVSEISKKSRRN